MNAPTKVEFKECECLVDTLMDELKKTNWLRDGVGYFNTHMQFTRFRSVSVTLKPVVGTYSDVGLIIGDSGVSLSVPNLKYYAYKATVAEKETIRRVLYGVLIHEIVHKIQELNDPTEYLSTLSLKRKYDLISEPTCDQLFDYYIGTAFEKEARANQAVAEIIQMDGCYLNESDFKQSLQKTAVLSRTESRIGNSTSESSKISNWWSEWSMHAWEIYIRLQTEKPDI